jgi:hypothetical protein
LCGAVHQNIDPAALGDDLCEGGANVIILAGIGAAGQSRPSGFRGDFRCGCPGGRKVSRHARNLGALLGQLGCNRLAGAAAAASDDRNLVA